ncbi:MAG: hydroxyacid dehydrogenase [Treponema sp.]|nr:hydroxyacid dehydrogenase [Treponema sp.]
MSKKMKILVTLQEGKNRDTHFPPFVVERLEKLGAVRFNDTGKPFTPVKLKEEAASADIVVTHWGCPCFTAEVLDNAPNLKLIAHAAGSVADLCSAAVYDRNIKVTSANDIMALYVAEGALAYILASLRRIPKADNLMKNKVLWPDENEVRAETLRGKKVSLIGLGATGRCLLRLLEPFNVSAAVYDPYIKPEQLAAENFKNVQLKPLKEALAFGDVISVHASLTPETRGLLGAKEFALIRDGGLIINTARGGVLNENALIAELQRGRISAVLDVYDPEPPSPDNPLRGMDNVILLPHMAGITARESMTLAIIDEIENFLEGKPLMYEIKRERFEKMTMSHLVRNLNG